MFHYNYLNKDHPEESMEPKAKKTKINKMGEVDPSVLVKYRINYNQIKQKNVAESSLTQTTSKIPILLSNGKPIVTGRDITIKPFVPKTEVVSNKTQPKKSTIPFPTTSKQLQIHHTPAKTMFFVKPGMKNILTKVPTKPNSSSSLTSNVSSSNQGRMFNPFYLTNQTKQFSTNKQCDVRSDIEDTVPEYTTVDAGKITLDKSVGEEDPSIESKARSDNEDTVPEYLTVYAGGIPLDDSVEKAKEAQPMRYTEEDPSVESNVNGANQYSGEQITEQKHEKCITGAGHLDFDALIAKLDAIDKKLDKLSINVDKKLDVLNVNGAAQKRLLGNLIAEFAEFKEGMKPLDGERGSPSNIYFPVENQESFQNLEILSRQIEYADALRSRFLKESTKDIYEFLRVNAEHLFTNTSRYSWSGKIAKNAKHSDISLKACDLNVVRILLESAMERFKVGRDVCVNHFKKALQNFNAAVHMQHVRQSSAVND